MNFHSSTSNNRLIIIGIRPTCELCWRVNWKCTAPLSHLAAIHRGIATHEIPSAEHQSKTGVNSRSIGTKLHPKSCSVMHLHTPQKSAYLTENAHDQPTCFHIHAHSSAASPAFAALTQNIPRGRGDPPLSQPYRENARRQSRPDHEARRGRLAARRSAVVHRGYDLASRGKGAQWLTQ
jgi:hypothetical protein